MSTTKHTTAFQCTDLVKVHGGVVRQGLRDSSCGIRQGTHFYAAEGEISIFLYLSHITAAENVAKHMGMALGVVGQRVIDIGTSVYLGHSGVGQNAHATAIDHATKEGLVRAFSNV